MNARARRVERWAKERREHKAAQLKLRDIQRSYAPKRRRKCS